MDNIGQRESSPCWFFSVLFHLIFQLIPIFLSLFVSCRLKPSWCPWWTPRGYWSFFLSRPSSTSANGALWLQIAGLCSARRWDLSFLPLAPGQPGLSSLGRCSFDLPSFIILSGSACLSCRHHLCCHFESFPLIIQFLAQHPISPSLVPHHLSLHYVG